MVRLKDVALKAGVSVSTVWRVLHRQGTLSPATERRVLEAIESLGYQQKGRSKKSAELKVVGAIIPDVENPFFSGIVKSLEFFLFRYGFFLLLCNTENNPDLEEAFVEYLGRDRIGGLILIPSRSEKRRIKFPSNTPVVFLDRAIKGSNVPVVAVNHYQGSRTAVSYLLRKGRKRIAFLGGKPDVNVYEERLRGYVDEIEASGLQLDPGLVVESDFSYQGGYQAADTLIQRKKEFDAVFAANDSVALGVLERLQKEGFTIPADVSVMGFDDIWLSQLVRPRLTTVHQPIHELCKEAVTLLLNAMDGNPQLASRILEPQLVVRESC